MNATVRVMKARPLIRLYVMIIYLQLKTIQQREALDVVQSWTVSRKSPGGNPVQAAGSRTLVAKALQKAWQVRVAG